ncbi:uncharacterized protein LOC125032930 [Penaeus chinensis]|uniref:uncharacterized protein LOC125032930 n=1 Tax=Penaeus chinensis TaxID=139456 RepID=UPI001FB63834|nr:uncharacterized protein LOC125032930 [Penaeus chinensis]
MKIFLVYEDVGEVMCSYIADGGGGGGSVLRGSLTVTERRSRKISLSRRAPLASPLSLSASAASSPDDAVARDNNTVHTEKNKIVMAGPSRPPPGPLPAPSRPLPRPASPGRTSLLGLFSRLHRMASA